jgi:hypothetical protein
MAIVAPAVTAIPRWVSAAQRVQDNIFLSKTLLETIALDGTMYAMGRNPVEKSGIFWSLFGITLTAGFLAPTHAKIYAMLAARLYGRFDHRLLCLGYKELASTAHLAEGMLQLEKEVFGAKKMRARPEHFSHNPDYLRTQVIKAKALLLALDLGTESILLLHMGQLKNWVTYQLTGKKQFAGEMGIVSSNELDQLYNHKQAREKPPLLNATAKAILLNGLSLMTPAAMAYGLSVAFLNPALKNGLVNLFRSTAHLFNNDSRGFTLGMIPYVTAFVFLNIGQYDAALSDNERLEVVVKKTPLFLTFMFGDLVLYDLFNKLLPSKGFKMANTISKTLRKVPEAYRLQAAKKGALLYLSVFALQAGLVSGVIYVTNKITRRRVKSQVNEMKQQQKPLPVAFNAVSSVGPKAISAEGLINNPFKVYTLLPQA